MTTSAEQQPAAAAPAERRPAAAAAEYRPAAVAAGAGRVPDFFIVGHPKCGTTALYEMLRAHPQIFMPEIKEPRFLASDRRRRFQPQRSGPLPKTLEQYLELFAAAPPEQLVGEASPSYLASHTAAGLIAQLQPAARIVAIVREPAGFLHSLHRQLVRSHVEVVQDFRKALALEQRRRRGRRIPRRSHTPSELHYSDYVRYVDQLRRYHAVFGREQVLVLIYDDFRADNRATVERVLRFLGVDERAPVAVADANPSVRVRSQRLDELLNAVVVGRGPVSRATKTALSALMPGALRRRTRREARRRVVNGRLRAPDERPIAELRARYRDEVEALSEYLGRDLVALWEYERT